LVVFLLFLELIFFLLLFIFPQCCLQQMSIFSHFSVFTLTVLVALIGRISATCADRVENAPSTIGTIIRPAEECANAKAVPFGFNANSVTFLSQVFFGTAIANEVGTGQVQTVSLNFHQSKKACHCTVDDVCIATVPSAHDCAIGEYVLPVVGSTVCLRFGRSASPPLTLPSGADAAAADSMFELGGNHLILAIDGVEVTYAAIAVATTDSGKQIKALMALRGNPSNNAIFYAGCGPFIVERDAFDGDSRKRTPEFSNSATGLAVQVEQLPPVGAGGDPHLFGAHGIEFDVYGKPAANYSLLVAPAFEINMQLADRGPEMRFMTSMAVLYQGKSFIITPWTVTRTAPN
jgi:hypothetical protein